MSKSRFLRKTITLTDLSKLANQPPICDFCGEHAPSALYAANRMQDGTSRDCWRWCACDVCDQDLQNGELENIIRRVVGRLRQTTPFETFWLEVATRRVMRDFLLDAIRDRRWMERN